MLMRTTIDISDHIMQVINQMCRQQHTTQDKFINKILEDYIVMRPVAPKKIVSHAVKKTKMNFAELMSTCPVKVDLDISRRTLHTHRDVAFS